ncbi:MAG: hydantoinase/oxoprolinase family protein [Pseudomonadota bacterium]
MADPTFAGWDLGGAHLKIAVVSGDGALKAVRQVPCALWQGLDRLDEALALAAPELTGVARHAVTMTGELVDLFPSRRSGVKALVGKMVEHFSSDEILIFGGTSGFLSPDDALGQCERVASANWLASARWAARRVENALFADLGSTTADLVPLANGEVRALGANDHERLACDELVYSGVTRTPVMAIARRVPFDGEWRALMAEQFATMADVHRITGRLPPTVDQHPAADGAGKSVDDSARRLARMVGRDLEEDSPGAWRGLARYLAERQLRDLADAAERVLSRHLLDDQAPLVGAGIGRFLLRDLAARLERPYRDFAELLRGPEEHRNWAACCAPAAAVALLALDDI